MKRFLCRCISVLLATAAIIWLGGQAYRHTSAWKNRIRDAEIAKYQTMPKQIDTAVFGISHALCAFLPQDYGENFFSFALSSQTPVYDWMQMRQYADRIQPGATVVLVVSYIALFENQSEDTEKSLQNNKYNRILSPWYIPHCDVGRWVLERFSPLLTDSLGDIVKAFIDPPELSGDIALAWQTSLQAEDLEREQNRIHQNQYQMLADAPLEGQPNMLNAYENMIEMCRSRQWNPVLVTVPYLHAYEQCLPKKTIPAYREIVAGLSEKYGVPWLDYSTNEVFHENMALFKDIDHLNWAGAAQLAELFCRDAAQLGLAVD